MDYYIDILEQFKGLCEKHTQIEFSLFTDDGEGIRGVIDPGDIVRNGPTHAGRDLILNVRLIAEYDAWAEMFEKMGTLEDRLNYCFTSDDQDVRLQVETGTWTREPDESLLIYVNGVNVKVVRTKEVD